MTAGAKRVLVVDDDPAAMMFVRMILEETSCEMISATTGKEALEQAVRHRPHVILLDVTMPTMDGLGCLRRLKASAMTKDIPVIMAGTKSGKSIMKDAYEAGAVDYVTKPFSKLELLRKLSGVWESRDTGLIEVPAAVSAVAAPSNDATATARPNAAAARGSLPRTTKHD